MKITELLLPEEELERRDYREAYEIEIDGKKVFEVADGEPEDSRLSRNFNDVFQIIDLLKIVYEAGKTGQPLEFEKKKIEGFF